MAKILTDLIPESDIQIFRMFLFELSESGQKHWLSQDLVVAFHRFLESTPDQAETGARCSIPALLEQTTELIILNGDLVLVHRERVATYRVYQFNLHSEKLEEVPLEELLDLKDRMLRPDLGGEIGKLRVDFMPFYDYGPRIRDVDRVGSGVEFLNRHLSTSLFQDPERWNLVLLEFLKLHHLDHRKLLVNGTVISSVQILTERLRTAVSELESYEEEADCDEVLPWLEQLGFEAGWGDTTSRIRETMQLLLELIQSPNSANLEQFIARIPMTSQIAIVSPHGWFGQENVLGRPDTGGQVVYILDQVRALESILGERLQSFGLDIKPSIYILTRLIPNNDGTTSNIRKEKVHFTENTYILRVPFTDDDGNVLQDWCSRFEVWPYLERYADTCYHELLAEMDGKPDLVIGNYSDGNLVATLLARRFGVTECCIAHALEKTKYEFSDLNWEEMESEKHFSLQFMADLISMNMTDFIITSTHQEIRGTGPNPGQYESYLSFTMPGLVQVKNGVNLFHPKFNVIPPGVDEQLYFPYWEKDRRIETETQRLEARLFTDSDPTTVGSLKDLDRPTIFTMARLDRVKNITGLVEAYATSEALRKRANLVVVAGRTSKKRSFDEEEREGIDRMHHLFTEYDLDGQVRWLEAFAKEAGAEAYRIIAERGGVFVQPAKFEGFGLTVLEAMACGLPTFATQFGGPSEIIIDGQSGFLLDPSAPDLIAEPLIDFFESLEREPERWGALSKGGIERVAEAFTWNIYGNRLINMTQLYGFWRYSVASEGKEELAQYCHLLFHLFFTPRAKAMLE